MISLVDLSQRNPHWWPTISFTNGAESATSVYYTNTLRTQCMFCSTCLIWTHNVEVVSFIFVHPHGFRFCGREVSALQVVGCIFLRPSVITLHEAQIELTLSSFALYIYYF